MFNNIYINRIYIVSFYGIIAGVSKDKHKIYKHTYALASLKIFHQYEWINIFKEPNIEMLFLKNLCSHPQRFVV